MTASSTDSTFTARDGTPYTLHRASWRDVFAVHRLERIVFPVDAYSFSGLLLLLLWRGLTNLTVRDPDGRIVGFASAGVLPGSGKLWIMTIGVHPDHQRRGVGRWLLAEAEARLAPGPVYLTVREGNHGALELYRQTGYRRLRLKMRYYPDGENGVEMRKDRR